MNIVLIHIRANSTTANSIAMDVYIYSMILLYIYIHIDYVHLYICTCTMCYGCVYCLLLYYYCIAVLKVDMTIDLFLLLRLVLFTSSVVVVVVVCVFFSSVCSKKAISNKNPSTINDERAIFMCICILYIDKWIDKWNKRGRSISMYIQNSNKCTEEAEAYLIHICPCTHWIGSL